MPSESLMHGFTLNHSEMDKTHREFLSLLDELNRIDKTRFKLMFSDFVAHTREHFEQENKWMKDSDFPAKNEHIAEHQRVLSELTQFESRTLKGSTLMARAWLKEQAMEWFKLHIATMDSALAAHLRMKLQNTG